MVFWVGTCLQIIIPSAASLAVILMATLFPVLRAAGMSTLTAAALIATTATIVPTPLGGDNVVAARVLGFENVVDYVAFHLAPITIPALFVMGIVHYFWQTYLDKKDAVLLKELDKETVIEAERPEKNTPTWYFVFPDPPAGFSDLLLGLFQKSQSRSGRNHTFLLSPGICLRTL